MHNQYTDLSQTLADQHRTRLQDQASHQRALPAVPQARRRHNWSPRRWWQLLKDRPSPRTS